MIHALLLWVWVVGLGCAMRLAGQLLSLDWAYAAGGTWDEWAECVAVDGAGNVYVTGRFSLTVDFDPGIGVTAYTVTSGQAGFYLLKLDAQGNFVCAHTIDSVYAT